jgi:hypothetical protein
MLSKQQAMLMHPGTCASQNHCNGCQGALGPFAEEGGNLFSVLSLGFVGQQLGPNMTNYGRLFVVPLGTAFDVPYCVIL